MRLAIAALALALGCASPASAQQLKLSSVTCSDFLKSGKENIGMILMWLQGFYAGDDDDAVIDFDKMAKNGEKLGRYCGANPGSSLAEAAEKVLAEE